ncbi:hypothetical protein BDK51DRAFT_38626 [Blyttiomyces helicus]|uniref:Uncharacterized protein n=1 Tax=Blyttiomyces helicus TaxID=388810 RepID=A0A4P9W1R0_9FUNG|nr:hypothetical protein BDK51DRAFT_38626 [Blyttiomyces helicus]|eukprot:RKO86044.1 hypothetical protein BDK51DRAFT_38626 [Blyttiomyces helicus]
MGRGNCGVLILWWRHPSATWCASTCDGGRQRGLTVWIRECELAKEHKRHDRPVTVRETRSAPLLCTRSSTGSSPDVAIARATTGPAGAGSSGRDEEAQKRDAGNEKERVEVHVGGAPSPPPPPARSRFGCLACAASRYQSNQPSRTRNRGAESSSGGREDEDSESSDERENPPISSSCVGLDNEGWRQSPRTFSGGSTTDGIAFSSAFYSLIDTVLERRAHSNGSHDVDEPRAARHSHPSQQNRLFRRQGRLNSHRRALDTCGGRSMKEDHQSPSRKTVMKETNEPRPPAAKLDRVKGAGPITRRRPGTDPEALRHVALGGAEDAHNQAPQSLIFHGTASMASTEAVSAADVGFK